MHIIFNELSVYPLASDGIEVVRRFRLLLETFKSARSRYLASHVLFPQNFGVGKISTAETFNQWLSALEDRTMKATLLSVYRRPFIDDLEDGDADFFLGNDFSMNEPGAPTNISPVGLPFAAIKKVPAISLKSAIFWEQRKFVLRLFSTVTLEDKRLIAYNLCNSDDPDSPELQEWELDFLHRTLDSIDLLIRFLNFNRYSARFEKGFFTELLYWKSNDREIFKSILELMKDVELNPFVGGFGKTERLKNSELCSKRITQGERLTYNVKSDTVTFVSCRGHYGEH